ncbi:MAG: NAD(P)-dependent oxidoreductase [Chloroflexaceae bacterium]|jgi:UDP-glucose 4-epimerase|nr:NAD(P)-dependent oxidoreductase [Chloroflexaceae bacterium]
MKIAVTGGSGELGRVLVPFLMQQGHDVVSIDRALPQNPFPAPPRLPSYLVADVGDLGQFIAAVHGCEALVHLAAHRSPMHAPAPQVYVENTASSYHALYAAATLGIKRVCLASSVNATGAAFSRVPRYDYVPLDENHPTYNEDPYSLSKWVLEQQADSFARRYEWMSIASMRFHWLVDSYAQAVEGTRHLGDTAVRHLWAYTSKAAACRACLLSLSADFVGHEVFYIVAPRTAAAEESLDLARRYFPDVPVRGELAGQQGFFDCRKAARVLGWQHDEAE